MECLKMLGDASGHETNLVAGARKRLLGRGAGTKERKAWRMGRHTGALNVVPVTESRLYDAFVSQAGEGTLVAWID